MDDRNIEFEIREVNEEERTVAGVAIPYGETVDVGGFKERIEKGAFRDTETGSPLYFQHDHRVLGTPIGTIVEARDTEDGLHIKARISKTAKGDEVYTLIKDGVLKKFSAGFEPVEHRTDDDGTVVRTKARLVEVSIVPRPAYTNAAIAQVREADNQTKENVNETMSNETEIAPEVVELREQVNDLERKFAVLGDKPAESALEIRSFGEFVKGLATGETRDKVELVTRAFTGATTTDSNAQPAWVNRSIRLVQENRDVLNLFSKAPLPATGLSVEYPVFGSKSGDVAEQAAEGDDLAYLELVIDEASTPVKTYGGYSSLSRQAIERSDVAYLNKVLEMQAISYAKVTNGVARTALTGASGVNTYDMAAAIDTYAGWEGAVWNATELIHTNSVGLEAEFMVVSPDTFQAIASVVDGNDRPIFVVNGDGSNSGGSVNVRGARANIAGLPVVVDWSLTGTFAYVANSNAVTVMESAGAPFRLADENIINLTKDFSLYGYMAIAVNDPKGIVKVDAAAS